ncbi:MAG: hypothetical protein KGL95_04850, partial [Patescibacteria group bacterium]|nr:hypothetical protein [Patescibacteria group bacterium]
AEIVLVVTITLILFGIMSVNLFHSQTSTNLDTVLQSFISDLKSQQIKAMVGATDGRSSTDNYGIYFTPTGYTLFHGLVYNPTDPANYSVKLDNNVSFIDVEFQNYTLVFLEQSGEVSTYSATQNFVTIKNNAGAEQKTITINRYGVITGIN